MGMTIDEAINRLENYYDTFCGYSDDGLCGAIYTAIDIMRKYKQIEQILKDIPYGGDATVRRIQEVIEDGND